MLILTCGYCGSRELRPADFQYEATCVHCGEFLPLWCMQVIYISGDDVRVPSIDGIDANRPKLIKTLV